MTHRLPLRRARFCALGLVLLLVLLLSAPILAKGDPLPATARRHWWDLDRAHRCGSLWCSRVLTPHTPLAPFGPRITLAVIPGAGEGSQQAAARVEARSSAVATTLGKLSRALGKHLDASPPAADGVPAGFWLDRRDKSRHPLTPSLRIGVKNRTPVIYLPADPTLKRPQVTLITLTEPDSLANDLDLETLAEQWKGLLEGTLSEGLWGASFNRSYPWGRSLAALVTLGLGVLGTCLCTLRLQGLYRRAREVRADLSRQQEAAKVTAEDSGETLRACQRLERQLRRTGLLVKLLQVLRIAVVVMALILALSLFPTTRLAAAFLMQQSIGLPVIWLAMVLLEGGLTWSVVRRLNRWAVDAQALNPTSLRPRMRLETNLRVLKGSIAAATSLLGAYLTLLLFGIQPQILAGAGIVAVAMGFLARSLVEDLISGIRILATDRFAIGDSIVINGHAGLVEAMNLVQTQLRGGEGEVVTIPNGMIRDSINRSKDWSRVNFEVDIAWDSDLQQACVLLQQVASALAEDPLWKDQILEPPQLLGVERLEQSGVRLKLWIKTQPLRQWAVAREFRHRLKPAFDAAGIAPEVPQQLLRRG
ncbi:MAG: hypothetical protein ER33_00830 [Cyanobium sp. CACIAM 14]|nr:MAG: hypothetical protein ER33_00830 [Cyanobium sp. CACIAM 14]